MEYWEMDIEKAIDFNFINEEIEEFTSKWIQCLVIVRSHSYLKQNTFEYFLWGTDYIFSFSFEHGNVFLVWVKYMVRRIFIYVLGFWSMIS